MKKIAKILFAVPAFVFFVSCDSSEQASDNKEEGIIEFDIKAVDKDNPLYALAPGSAVLKFKKEKFAVELNSYGVFKTSIIGDTKTRTLAQTVNFMDVKQVCIETEEQVKDDYKDFKVKIEETKETKKIAGFNCIKAHVSMLDDPAHTFDVWYTKELGMDDSNVLTPYAELKGVLMDYRVKKMGLELHFLATSFKNVAVDDKTFVIDPSMKVVSREEMAAFFTSLQ